MITIQNAGELLHAAARNNAAWCAAVCGGGEFTADAWTSARRTPPYYPDAVTLTRDVPAAALAAALDTDSPGCSVKDSFAVLDLAPAGFEVLFEAQWIHRPADAAALGGTAPALAWSRVADAAELGRWEAAWDGERSSGLFHPGLLTGDIAFLAGRDADGRIRAGAVANAAAGVVGVSNVFAAGGAGDDEAWAGALAGIAELWPELPIVGYESGEDLRTAARHGFTGLGPLRVWLHTAQTTAT
ncbi:hypothetical protein [Streptomyces sp. BR123]|uniref:hypothetical protein n=1 Tax=Streptomyces sp. BR123 TaxID=2749828 RepID=UPI00281227A0|nr:hypothetical protein [Streptomyces sp. BR123]